MSHSELSANTSNLWDEMKICYSFCQDILLELRTWGHKWFLKTIFSEMYTEGNALFWMTKARSEDERTKICQQNSMALHFQICNLETEGMWVAGAEALSQLCVYRNLFLLHEWKGWTEAFVHRKYISLTAVNRNMFPVNMLTNSLSKAKHGWSGPLCKCKKHVGWKHKFFPRVSDKDN